MKPVFTGEEIASILQRDLAHAFSTNAAIRLSDPAALGVSRDDINMAADEVWSLWRENVNDCDKQALAVVAECHRRAAAKNGTVPWAVGFLRANTISNPRSSRVDHMYCWFIEPDRSLTIFDQTNRLWHTPGALREVDFVFG